MRAQRARRLAAVSTAGILMAGGAAIGAAGTAEAAPAVHTHVTTNWCGDLDNWGGNCFDHRFDHRSDHRFDHQRFLITPGGFVIIVL
ncbi:MULTISPECIES: hypothetical protein [unclassified Streptomyces]|uniref:hypothetical protein n=1 Tax=unclassified Streptomyces TaxID=2593676 RepID=UPI002DDBC8AE|nr:hypothetical protein [Streptomyces sp. NBC_01750]WSB01269.1 hypothetical protein OIE54_19300 [Streptomyces sp. NBC_01794]WSD34385.1 hypothetical protein OG966_22365 [Streptomyces sp. NBC_01750]